MDSQCQTGAVLTQLLARLLWDVRSDAGQDAPHALCTQGFPGAVTSREVPKAFPTWTPVAVGPRAPGGLEGGLETFPPSFCGWVFFPLKTAACLTRFRRSGVPVGAFSPASVFMPEDIWVFFEAVLVGSVFPRFLLGE